MKYSRGDEKAFGVSDVEWSLSDAAYCVEDSGGVGSWRREVMAIKSFRKKN